MAGIKTLNVIGAGRLGSGISALLSSTGQVQVQDVLNRTPESGEAAVKFIGQGRVIQKLKELRPAQFNLLAVPDTALPKLAYQLHKYELLPHNSIAFHCSTVSTAEEYLGPLVKQGVSIASVTPLQRFGSSAETVELFRNTPVGIEGNSYAVKQLFRLFKGIGARAFQIETEKKALGDVATNLASAGLVSSVEAAIQVLVQSGVRHPDALMALRPVIVRTLNNMFDFGSTGAALSGPVAQGDVRTAMKHLEALDKEAPHVRDLYKALGGFAVDAVDALPDQYRPEEAALDQLVELFRLETEADAEEEMETETETSNSEDDSSSESDALGTESRV